MKYFIIEKVLYMCKVLHSSEEWWKDKMEEELMEKTPEKWKAKVCTLMINPRQANWGWIGPWTAWKSGGVAYSSKLSGSLNPCAFGRPREGEWRTGTFTLGVQRKSRQSFRGKATFFPPSLSSCFVRSFLPSSNWDPNEVEENLYWDKSQDEI